jgi:hypothetical protein
MAKARKHRSSRSHRDRDGPKKYEHETVDDPEEHREIERSRFRGGLPATPEMYARAREQWYRLPGSLGRPPMDPVVGNGASGEPYPPGQGHPGGKRPER